MKLKLKNALTRMSFSETEVSIIMDSCSDYETRNDEKLTIILKLSKMVDFFILKKINEINNKQENIVLKIEYINEYAINDIKELLAHLFNASQNKLLLSCVNYEEIEIQNSNLIIHYSSNKAQIEWNRNKPEILKFFNDFCFLLINDLMFLESNECKEFNSKKEKIISTNRFSSNKSELNSNKVSNISDLIVEMKIATIEVDVLKIDFKLLKNDVKLYTILVEDKTSCLYLKAFAKSDNDYLADIHENMHIRAKISLEIDKYENNNQLVGTIKNWIKFETKKKTDDAAKPRIEVAAHTKMSAFDGLITPKKMKETLDSYNQKVIAFTDRYNVQAYPEISKAFSGTDIKVIYGLETEVLEDKYFSVLNPTNESILDSEYVVFDLETTGLFPAFHDIIEFGAVRYKNGMVLDRKQFFIKPNVPISEKTKEITNITEKDVVNAMSQKEGLQEILDYVKDSILIAHNGINFDFNFLNVKLEQYGFKKLNNCMIDTLIISRGINQFRSNTLERLAKNYKIEYATEDAHRADYDADVLAKVWGAFMPFFTERKIYTIDKLDSATDNERLKNSSRGHFINIYAKNQEGLKNIYEIVSKTHTDFYHGRPTITKSELENFRKNLVITNSPIESDVINGALSFSDTELEEVIKYYDYVLVTPPLGLDHEIILDNISIEESKKAILRIVNISKKIKKKMIGTSGVYYIDKADRKFHDIFVNIPILNRRRHRFWRSHTAPLSYYRTTDEMTKEFEFLNDSKLIEDIVVNNSYDFNDNFESNVEPLKKKLYPPKIEGVNEKVTEEVNRTAHSIYGDNLPDIVVKRIKKELDSIIGNGYAVVYWISHLLVTQSLNDGYVVGSRGSVGSSLVATLLSITDVNPLKPHYICKKCKFSDFSDFDVDDGYDLKNKPCTKCDGTLIGEGHNIPFETFLGFNGDKVPDIDLNFSGVYQPKAHNFIKEMFGEKHSFRAGTISTIAEKTSFANAREYFENIEKKATNAQIHGYALKCQDVKRTTGQHPGGIIVVPEDMSIFDFTPYNFPADDTKQSWKTTHFAFEYIHDNLLKFDILGHDNPTALRMLKDLTGVDEKEVPMNDEKTLSLFSSNEALNIDLEKYLKETTGAISIPEFGTKFVREMLRDAQPKSFADLIRISGLSHGTDVWSGNARDLIKDNGLTLKDVIGCRDDIMVYLINKGVDASLSFQIMEDVRKGKTIKPEHEKVLVENNIPRWYIDSANKIKYMFPKAHATAYVFHAWKFAWYKINFPLEYYATYFSVRSSIFDVQTLTSSVDRIVEQLQDIRKRMTNKNLMSTVTTKEKDLIPLFEVAIEMKLRGLEIKLIDFEKSDANDFILDKETNSIICPFSSLDGLGEAVADSIVEARKNGPFMSIEDLKNRTKITSQSIKKLKELGVLDNLSESNQISLFDL